MNVPILSLYISAKRRSSDCHGNEIKRLHISIIIQTQIIKHIVYNIYICDDCLLHFKIKHQSKQAVLQLINKSILLRNLHGYLSIYFKLREILNNY